MFDKMASHILIGIWILILTCPHSFAQHKLFFSMSAGKYYNVLFPGFAYGNKYDPFNTESISHDDYDLRIYSPTHYPRYIKKVTAGYYISKNRYIDFSYYQFSLFGAIECKYQFEYLAQTFSIGYNKEYKIFKSELVTFVNNVSMYYQLGKVKGDSFVVTSFLPLDCHFYSAPPKIKVSALGIGYSPSLHIKIWKTFFATLNPQVTLFLLGKNAGFQPLQINLMLGLAWKPAISKAKKQ